jgi:hypothetical protein
MTRETPDCLAGYAFPEFEFEIDGWEYWTVRQADEDRRWWEHFAIRGDEMHALDYVGHFGPMTRRAFGLMIELNWPSRHSMANLPEKCGGVLAPLRLDNLLALYGWQFLKAQEETMKNQKVQELHDEVQGHDAWTIPLVWGLIFVICLAFWVVAAMVAI